jgi:hypothetical protein
MTTTEERHPSTLTLDVFHAGGGRADGVVDVHLAVCASCRRYIEELDRAGDAPLARPISVPPPREAERRAADRTPRGWRLRMASVGGLVAAAAGAVLLVRTLVPGNDAAPYVGTKGTPAVQALIHRDHTSVWDGHSAIRAGDAIALRVACEGFPEVTVATPSDDRAGWTRLFEGACPVNTEPLKFTLVADDEPGEEHVAVILRRGALDDRQLKSAIHDKERTANTWTVELIFPKTDTR